MKESTQVPSDCGRNSHQLQGSITGTPNSPSDIPGLIFHLRVPFFPPSQILHSYHPHTFQEVQPPLAGWDGGNFLHSSLYSSRFGICDQTSVDNTPMS